MLQPYQGRVDRQGRAAAHRQLAVSIARNPRDARRRKNQATGLPPMSGYKEGKAGIKVQTGKWSKIPTDRRNATASYHSGANLAQTSDTIQRAIDEWKLVHPNDEPFLDEIEMADPRVRMWREILRQRYNFNKSRQQHEQPETSE